MKTNASGASKIRRASPRTSTRRTPPQPSYRGADAIRQRAYELYLERGGVHGDPVADWLRAERELGAKL